VFDGSPQQLPHVDYLLPTTKQILGWTGESSLEAAAHALLSGARSAVAATAGADGAIVVTADRTDRVAGLRRRVVDTTGCGDAFSAGSCAASRSASHPTSSGARLRHRRARRTGAGSD